MKWPRTWFDELWAEAEDYRERLIEIITAREEQAWTPHDIYLRALLELYGEELELLEGRRRGGVHAGSAGRRNVDRLPAPGFRRALRISSASTACWSATEWA